LTLTSTLLLLLLLLLLLTIVQERSDNMTSASVFRPCSGQDKPN